MARERARALSILEWDDELIAAGDLGNESQIEPSDLHLRHTTTCVRTALRRPPGATMAWPDEPAGEAALSFHHECQRSARLTIADEHPEIASIQTLTRQTTTRLSRAPTRTQTSSPD